MDIIFKKLSHYYNYHSPMQVEALKDINLTIKEHLFTSIIGHTGSGKSTLIQHLNGLILPDLGTVDIMGHHLKSKMKKQELYSLRGKVGIVFQFPENQLYESTVIKDISVGPINFGKSEDEAKKIAYECLNLVGLSSNLAERSPFELSGGQMRKVAIAGILAIHPQVLVLDEPTAGLDPKSHDEMMNLFLRLHNDWNLTTIMISHQMDDVAKYSDEVVVLKKGEVVQVGTPEEIFSNDLVSEIGYPRSVEFYQRLQKRGVDLPNIPLTKEALVNELKELLNGRLNE